MESTRKHKVRQIKTKDQLRRLPVIYKRFKLRKKDLLRYGIFHIFAKINSPYAKMGGTPLYPILESQTAKAPEPYQNFLYDPLL